MKLSKHFSLSEFISSNTAERLGIDNVPKDKAVIENLRNLCLEILQPLRDYVGAPVHINSGYRCPELNDAVGGVLNFCFRLSLLRFLICNYLLQIFYKCNHLF